MAEKETPMAAAQIAKDVDLKKVERYLLLQHIATSTVKGFDENRKRNDIWKAVVADWDWDELVTKPPQKAEYNETSKVTLSRSVIRNTVALIKEVFETEYWNGVQGNIMLAFHDRLAFILDGGSDEE